MKVDHTWQCPECGSKAVRMYFPVDHQPPLGECRHCEAVWQWSDKR